MATGLLVVISAWVFSGCSTGPSAAEIEEFDRLAIERQTDLPAAFPASVPTSIAEYVLGGPGIAPAELIVTGSFTDGQKLLPQADAIDATAFTLIGTFQVHKVMRGDIGTSFDVNLGEVHGAFLADDALRGADNLVLFLRKDRVSGQWVLVDGGWALIQSDQDGIVSMPFIPANLEYDYTAGVVDVGDIEGMVIAGGLDPNGSLNGTLQDLGNDGMTGSQNDLIDQANDLGD
jgi:hypothetical protein